MTRLRIGGVSINQTPLDWDNNLKNIFDAIAMAREKGLDILCLPELCITGYGCEDLFLSDWLPEKALEQLKQVVDNTEGLMVSLGLPVRRGDLLYNCVCVIEDGEIKGFNPKQNLANEGVHYEPRWFTPGTVEQIDFLKIEDITYPFGDNIYQYKGLKIGFEICEDAWSGENRPACRLYDKGVNLILNGSASHFALRKADFRKELIRSSSEDFECTYVYVNPLGNESGRLIFDGQIIIADHGQLINTSTLCSYNEIDILHSDIDFKNFGSNPVRKNIDGDVFEEFTAAVTLGLFDYLRKSGSQGFVLSLSGGADSSSCAVLVAEMVKRGISELGKEKFVEKIGVKALKAIDTSSEDFLERAVHEILKCAYQGTKNSSKETFDSAKHLAESIGANFFHWNIDDDVESYTEKVEKAIGRDLSWEQDDISLQNIQARARAPIIWMMANIYNSLLITTSNRSEGDVGYATMDGDTSGSLAPIAAIDKKFILDWLIWAEKNLGYEGLTSVNRLNPTAELRPPEQTQTDEDDLMPYAVITEIERLAIGKRLSPVQIYKRLSDEGLENNELLKVHIGKFFRLWSRNQWKRERIAPSFHLDDFNVDPKTWYRFPILSGGYKHELEELEKL